MPPHSFLGPGNCPKAGPSRVQTGLSSSNMILDTSGPYLLLRVHSSYTYKKGFSFAKTCHVSVYMKYIRTVNYRPRQQK